jgi:crotonobetainyl-CoA:carnitine CoA-transferase CaiB-like acyl-CoA transferase
MIQGMGGLMSITGERDDLPGGGPQKAGVAVTDIMTGQYASIAILAALQERHRSGLGQHLDMALLDCHVAMPANQTSNFLTSGVAPRRAGNAHQNVVPYQVFATSDGYMIVAVGNDSQFRAYCKTLGAPELADDARFLHNSDRIAHRDALIARLADLMKTGKRDDWIAALNAAGVPCGPINDIAQVFADPQVKARELRREIPHPLGVTAPTTASPMRFSATPVQYRYPPPMLGQHTEEILREVLGKQDSPQK